MKKDLEQIKKLAVDAGSKMIDREGVTNQEVKSGIHNFVISKDIEINDFIIEFIQKHFPQDSISTEETDDNIEDLLREQALWIIDPVDGTHNYKNDTNFLQHQ
jgi:myo-inositol-1(or 4)-monophosphatase